MFYRFCLITPFLFWHTKMILHIGIKRDSRWTSVDFEVKSLGHILSLHFVPFPHGGPISFLHTMMIWWGQDVKCKGYICVYFMFELLIVSVLLLYYLLTYNYDTSHMCFLWAKEDFYFILGSIRHGLLGKFEFVATGVWCPFKTC